MFKQLLARRLFGKHPIIQFEYNVFVAKIAFKVLLVVAFVQHFLGCKAAQKLFYIVERALSGDEFARRNVEKSHAASCFSKVNGGQEVVFLIVKYVVAHCYSWRNQFGYAAFHERFR